MSAVFRKPKTFRLRALHSQRKFGVAGWSCQEVLQKGCRHFQLPVTGSRLCLYEDGTELTGDYFWGVPDNSELVLLTSGQTWQGYVSDISRLLSAFHKPHAGLIQAAQQLLSDEQAPLRQKLLADLLHTVSENIAAETRAEDPPWFEGLESRFRSKSGYLRYSCESRIRSYLREVNSYASVVGVEAQEEYSRIVDVMCRELRAAQYNGSYFDRGAEAGGRLCTSEGWFCCQGPFDMDTCASKHSINPYGNRESRVLFSTWNLDHMHQAPGLSPGGLSLRTDVMGSHVVMPHGASPSYVMLTGMSFGTFVSASLCEQNVTGTCLSVPTCGFRAGLWALCALRLGRRPCSLDSCVLVWGVRGPPSEPGRRDSGVSGRRPLSASSVAALERLSPGTWSVCGCRSLLHVLTGTCLPCSETTFSWILEDS
ncbi:DNA fragmentation factor subunit beta isoform X1 [Halichoerus grypus]|uniref:DNA fragmentation factor subunit beta isoform X1 n=1 Tax=Halichoerus grypus TaxID=9711 RepID=UPI001658EA57|nr:DNA fragmentation factor subunit beta isoform X1 [Halichoerus grypus]